MNRFRSLISMDTPIVEAIARMGRSEDNKNIAGVAVVVDQDKRVTAVVTDGDVRRGLASGIQLSSPVSAIANRSPLVVNSSLTPALMRKAVIEETRKRNVHFMKYDKIILADAGGCFQDVILLSELFEPHIEDKRIAIYGLGFVGLTLACTFANMGLSIIGIDTNAELIENLKGGVPPFYEKGLDSMLSSLTTTNPIAYTTSADEYEADVHIVSVGSPVDADGTPQLGDIKRAAETIAKRLKEGDLVIFRSTVPIGTMREIVVPMLEKPGFACGKDFFLAFAPERTVEGNALEELRSLPQVIGGINRPSATIAAKLFRQITPIVIEVESLEEAELIKLINNTFRDLVFAFANEVAYLCDAYNINAFNAIRAANEGYPRNRIPTPSPGVGGICLSKDPYLYAHPLSKDAIKPILGVTSRAINGRGPDYVLGKLQQLAGRTGRDLADLRIMIIGLAFKGMPETSDFRASMAYNLIERLPDRAKVWVKDYVVAADAIEKIGCRSIVAELEDAFSGFDAFLFMNNHYRNNKFNVVKALRSCKQPVLLFDGWNMFDQREIESLEHVYYATMGYMTPGLRA